jgi:hypothetical protein
MVSIVVLFLAVLIIALTRAFIANARTIFRDLNDRFDRIKADLEVEANRIVQVLLDEDTREVQREPRRAAR